MYLVCNYTRTITSRPPLRLYHPDSSSRTSRGGRGARAPVTQTLRSPPLAAESRLCFALPVPIDALDSKFKLTAAFQKALDDTEAAVDPILYAHPRPHQALTRFHPPKPH